MLKKILVGAAAILLPLVLVFGVLFSIIFLAVTAVGGVGGLNEYESASSVSNVPAEYADIVNRAGSICAEITPSLIAAQVEAESNWDADAGSLAGAQGIAQFMPSTWAVSGLDGDGDGAADILNPIDSIWSQGNLMCSNVSTVKTLIVKGTISGDVVELALAAYNAGMGNVIKYGGIPPFGETQGYVAKILELQANYTGSSANSGTPLAYALALQGTPYRGEGDGGVDCCTLVYNAFLNTLGIELPMSTSGVSWSVAKCEYAMYSHYADYGGTRISADLDTLKAGDIVFFQSMSVSAAYDNTTHVGIYAGDGKVVDSIPGKGVGVRELSYYRNSDALLPYAVRVPGAG